MEAEVHTTIEISPGYRPAVVHHNFENFIELQEEEKQERI